MHRFVLEPLGNIWSLLHSHNLEIIPHELLEHCAGKKISTHSFIILEPMIDMADRDPYKNALLTGVNIGFYSILVAICNRVSASHDWHIVFHMPKLFW